MEWKVVVVARVWCAAFAVCAAAGRAAGTDTLTLDDAVTRALRDAPAAKIARLEAGQADDAAAAARSIYYPRASVSSQAGYSNRQDDTVDALNGQYKLKRYPLSSLGSSEPWLSLYLEQMVFDLRQWRSAERSQLEAEVAQVVEAQQRETISDNVLNSYLDVVRLEQLGALDRQRVTDAEWLNRQAGLLLDAGRALARVHLRASLAGLSVGFLNQAIEVPTTRAKVGEIIGAGEVPQILLRIGYGPPVPAQPRRPLERFLID